MSLLPFSLFYTAASPSTIQTLSLHDALPISIVGYFTERHRTGDMTVFSAKRAAFVRAEKGKGALIGAHEGGTDRKSTRLNSSHRTISYAVFCLKKKTDREHTTTCRHNTFIRA